MEKLSFTAHTSRMVLIAFAFALILLLLSFWGGLENLVFRWMQQEEYSHGFFIPIISLWLLWKRRDALVQSVGSPSPLGILLILLAVCLGLSFQRLFDGLDYRQEMYRKMNVRMATHDMSPLSPEELTNHQSFWAGFVSTVIILIADWSLAWPFVVANLISSALGSFNVGQTAMHRLWFVLEYLIRISAYSVLVYKVLENMRTA